MISYYESKLFNLFRGMIFDVLLVIIIICRPSEHIDLIMIYSFPSWPVMQGKCLTKDTKQPSYIVSLLDWLWARTIAAILLPLHMLAKKIVYSKIHSGIGISKV